MPGDSKMRDVLKDSVEGCGDFTELLLKSLGVSHGKSASSLF